MSSQNVEYVDLTSVSRSELLESLHTIVKAFLSKQIEFFYVQSTTTLSDAEKVEQTLLCVQSLSELQGRMAKQIDLVDNTDFFKAMKKVLGATSGNAKAIEDIFSVIENDTSK